METRLIQLYTKGEIVLTFAEKANGLVVVLLDDNNTPSAKYGFDKEKHYCPKKFSHKVS